MFRFGKDTKTNNEEVSAEVTVHIHDEDTLPEAEVGQVALDILDTEHAIYIIAPMAGIGMEEIDISTARNVLTIAGERQRPDIYLDVTQMLVSECFFGRFSRSVILPENLALNKITATIENNLLTIHIPKIQFPSKSIKISRLEK